jgi:hypothetical protein
MDLRRTLFPDRIWLPAVAAVMGASFIGAAAAQQPDFVQRPEIQFGKLDPARALPASADAPKNGAVAPPEGEKVAPATVPGSPVTPHVGLDVGGSGATLDTVARPSPGGVQNSYDPDRRYRAKAGVDYDVNNKIQLGLGYTYSNYERPDLVLAPAPDTELESQQREQAAKFSLRYKFGGS